MTQIFAVFCFSSTKTFVPVRCHHSAGFEAGLTALAWEASFELNRAESIRKHLLSADSKMAARHERRDAKARIPDGKNIISIKK